MLDVSLFGNPRFAAACAAVTVSFFTLLGFIFLMTQYFQFIKRYDPLSAGVHLLPVAGSVAVASVLGTKLAVRFGTKLVVSLGLAMVCGFYLWVALVVSPTTTYATIAAQMVLYGVGMGLTSAPATEAIMGEVPREKAGVGSAVNDATRLLGGTLGVAVIGSVYASLYASRLASRLPARIPAPLARAAHASVGSALGVAERISAAGHPALAAGVAHAASAAFIDGLSAGCLVACGVAAAGAAMAAAFLPAQPAHAAIAAGEAREARAPATA
jgi:Na+/melibiose symporter-like transporter